MSDNVKANIGYFVAGFGGIIILITLFLLYDGILPVTDSKWILITLIIVGAILVGLGMYVVVPKEAHDAVTDFGGVARDIVPKFGLRSRTGEQPTPVAVAPAPGQSAVVQPPAGPAVAVSPEGDVTTADGSAVDPEVATGAALPLASRPVPQRTGKIGSATHQRQKLYPPNEA